MISKQNCEVRKTQRGVLVPGKRGRGMFISRNRGKKNRTVLNHDKAWHTEHFLGSLFSGFSLCFLLLLLTVLMGFEEQALGVNPISSAWRALPSARILVARGFTAEPTPHPRSCTAPFHRGQQNLRQSQGPSWPGRGVLQRNHHSTGTMAAILPSRWANSFSAVQAEITTNLA